MRQFAFLAAIWSLAANAQKLPHDLTAATLEELMNFEVTSVSKEEQKFVAAAVAIFVITQENIRRFGLTTIPEILRLVTYVSEGPFAPSRVGRRFYARVIWRFE